MAKAGGTVSGIGLVPLAVLFMARGAPPRARALARAESTQCALKKQFMPRRATSAARANFKWTGKLEGGACWAPPRPPAPLIPYTDRRESGRACA